jgi:crotonobetainyl-CoA:carnitine CoA-transferase CaiB-like acyl-CoA transferase
MRPLAGIRVVEAASYVSGPYASLLLADLGADVIKVEPPRGDPMRRFGVVDAGGTGFAFTNINRNKRSQVVDLKTPEGFKAFQEMLVETDILITNWRPQVGERLGLADLNRRYPELIWVRMSGFGQDGPLAELPAFDAIVQARSGLVMHNGPTPTVVPGYLSDKVTGMFAVQAALAGLNQRSTEGGGSVIDISMLDSMACFVNPDLLSGHLLIDNPDMSVADYMTAVRPLKTKDGWFVISPVSGRHLKSTIETVGHPEWATQLREVQNPTEMIGRLYELMETVLPTRTSKEWERAFRKADVPAGPVLGLSEHLADDQVNHSGIYHEVHDGTLGRVRRTRHPALFDGKPVQTDDLAAPHLDEPLIESQSS